MIDFKALGTRTNGASAVLFDVQRLDIGGGERSAVVLLARPVGGEVLARFKTNVLNVVGFPLGQLGTNLLGMLCAVALVYFCRFVRIALAVIALLGSLVSRACFAPLLRAGEGALSAVPIRREARRYVSVIAGLRGVVMFLAALFGGRPFGRRFPTGVEPVGSIPVALHAATAARPSFRGVSVLARFRNCVEAFTGGLSRKSFWHGSHTHTLVHQV